MASDYNGMSALAYRSKLMSEGLSYDEAQAVLLANTGHDLYKSGGQTLIVNSPAPAVQSSETINILSSILDKAKGSENTTSQPVELKELQKMSMMQPLTFGLESNESNSGSFLGSIGNTVSGIGNMFSGLGDMMPLLLIMMLFGGGGLGSLKSLLPMMLLLPMLGAGSSGTSGTTVGNNLGFNMGNIDVSQVALWALLPKMSSMMPFLLGGVSGMLGQSMKQKKRTYRRRYTNYSYRRPYYRRSYRR